MNQLLAVFFGKIKLNDFKVFMHYRNFETSMFEDTYLYPYNIAYIYKIKKIPLAHAPIQASRPSPFNNAVAKC